MSTNTNFNAQGSSSPVQGGYAQPAAGVTEAIVTPADPSGNAYATALASSGTANLQISQYRDSIVTVNAGGTSAAPGLGATVVTITPGTAGLWEITGSVAVAGAGVLPQVESNNFQLLQAASAKINPITIGCTVTAAATVPLTATVLSLGATDPVLLTTVRAASANTAYSATLVARRVG